MHSIEIRFVIRLENNVCGHVHALFSLEMLQAGAVNWLSYQFVLPSTLRKYSEITLVA